MGPSGGPSRGTAAAMRVLVCVSALLAAAGCSRAIASRPAGATPRNTSRPQPTLESQIARTRALSAQARPPSGTPVLTVETWDSRLSSALAELALAPTAHRHRQVASEYRRLGILDVAYSHLTRAVRVDPDDAAAYEALARIWRDWGFAHLGLADAWRAVTLAPASASAANTLATLFAAMGQLGNADAWFGRALTLEPGAPYALNNLCYTAVMQGRPDAVSACEKATAAQPASQVAHNNLALAYAARGDLVRARDEFEQAGDAASHYNMGIVYMAQQRYKRATAAFQAALQADPHLPRAAARASQSRALLARHGDTDGDD